MLQQVEYDPNYFVGWLRRFPNLSSVIKRQNLVWTTKVKLIVGLNYIIAISLLTLGLLIISLQENLIFGLLLIFITPFICAFSMYFVALFAWVFYEKPRRKILLQSASKQFSDIGAQKVAIIGSYGKTTAKEIISAFLGSNSKVAYSPGNKNVDISHAVWVSKLSGNEDYLVIEFGEGKPGDVSVLSKLTSPDLAIITGFAPNHLDRFKTLKQLEAEFLSIQSFVEGKSIYINQDDKRLAKLFPGSRTYSSAQVLGWSISKITTSIEGTKFCLKKGDKSLAIETPLLGQHLVGIVALGVVLAIQNGSSENSVKAVAKKLQPFPHRMQQRRLKDAWIIDDTYNGNLEGIRAGLNLLGTLEAKRKIYVTPGLVDQGVETENVHNEIGKLIAEANPDKVFLMKNSVVKYISSSARGHGYRGELEIVDDPLAFYTNLEHFVVSGDLVLMQNDWTDNYN